MRTWSWRRRLLVFGGPAVGIWLVAVVATLLSARSAASDGAAELRSLRREATIESLGQAETAERLDRAASALARAEARTSSPVLWPLRAVPVVSRHVVAADRAVRAGRDATEVAQRAATEVAELVDRPGRTGADRLLLLRELTTIAEQTESALGEIDPGRPDALVGPLARAVQDLEEQRAGAEQGAGRVAATSEAVARLLAGPEPYLLLAANNAEMRHGSGTFLSAAEIGFDGGSLSLSEVHPTADLVLPEGQVPVDGDLAANWPWLDVGRDLRSLGFTADHPQSAEVAVRTWEALKVADLALGSGGGPVAGAIVVDVDGVRALLRAVGPVEIDGVTYEADSVRGELLREQYRRYDDEREERRDVLGEVARAIFDRLEAGEWELDQLVGELTRAVQGRHLLVWSSDPSSQEVWEDIGVAGRLSADSVAVGFINRSATKLDSWIETHVDLDVGDVEGATRPVELRYEISSTAPADGPPYLVGPNVDGLEAGDHVGLVVVNLPEGTTAVEVEGGSVFLLGGDGPTVVVAAEVTVTRGEQATVVVSARLPADRSRVVLEPTARIPRTTWTVDGEDVEVDRRRGISL